MTTPSLFHESITDALREVVQALGGFKKVGASMRQDRTPDEAARWVADCLNTDRREHFDPDQVLWLLREGRRVGCHAAATYLMREAGYADPLPIEPEDEKARLEREFIAAAKTVSGIADRLARPLNQAEALRRIKARFWTAVSPNHGRGMPVRVYYLPQVQDITTRTVYTRDGRAGRPLPRGAVLVGTYEAGASVDLLLADIAALLGRTELAWKVAA